MLNNQNNKQGGDANKAKAGGGQTQQKNKHAGKSGGFYGGGGAKGNGTFRTNSGEGKGGRDRNRFSVNPMPMPAYSEADVICGKIEGNSKGFGFLVRDDGGEDLFVPARDMGGAMHGDSVKAIIASRNRGAGEARVIEVTARFADKIVGTFQKGGNGGFVVPDNPHFFNDIHIMGDRTLNAENGQKVLVKVVEFPEGRKPEGAIEEILGFLDDVGVDILSIIRAYNLYEEFPESVLKEAQAVPQIVKPEQEQNRKDFRDETVVTIDGDDSKDFDDAVTLTRKDGLWRLGVHIADVAEYVRTNSKLDKEALKRATSVYFVDRVLPMLPTQLSNGICSLNEGEDRLALSVVMYFDPMGALVRHKIYEGVIQSKARLTYSKVAAVLDGDEALRAQYVALVPMLENMRTLAELLNKRRTERGNIEFDISESQIDYDEKTGKVINITKRPRLISHKMIEEFMLITNETVAEHFAALKCPFVFRAHDVPPSEKTEALLNFLSALGITFPGNQNKPEPRDYAKLLADIAGKDTKIAPVVNRVALRSMSKATYEPSNIGHFGLAAPFYCHFTSPIRRYPDLMIHRIIKDYLREGEKTFKKYESVVGEVSKISSERERLAEQAERKVDDLKKAEYMVDKIGQKFGGVISGVTEWGIFVELSNSVEGLVRAESLPGGGYVLNASLFRLDSPTHSFRLGDEIKIEVSAVSGDRVSFVLDGTYQGAIDAAKPE